MNSDTPHGEDQSMMPHDTQSVEPEAQVVELDPAQIQYLQQQLETEQNLPLGIAGGVVASVAGAAVWAGITFATNYQIGFMAIGIGFLVGFAVRSLGKGVTNAFGVIGAGLSLFGCALGNLLAVTASVAKHYEVPFGSVLSHLNPQIISELMSASFSIMDILFYGIAVYYGFKLSFRRLSKEDLERLLPGAVPST